MKSKKDNIVDPEEKFYYIGQIYDLSTVRKRNFFSFIIFVIVSIVDDSFGIWLLWTTMLPFCLDARLCISLGSLGKGIDMNPLSQKEIEN